MIRNRRLSSAVLLTAALTVTASTASSQNTVAVSRHIVRQVDHIMAEVGNRDEVRTLASFFADTLALPLSWEPRLYDGTDEGEDPWVFFSSGVFLGNATLEFITFDAAVSANPSGRVMLSGIGFEPEMLEKVLAELARREIPNSGVNSFVWYGHDGRKQSPFATIVFPGSFLSRPPMVFLSEFREVFFPWSTTTSARTIVEHRIILQGRLKDHDGGTLGVTRLSEIVLAVPDVQRARQQWQRLLDPITPVLGEDLWQLGAGPSLRLVPGAEPRVESLLVEVADLERARSFLDDHALLEHAAGDRVQVRSGRLGGMKFILIGR